MSAIVTICVLTYNPDWTKLRTTLRSIICQKNIDFDIVISDDGSKIDCFDQVKLFFQENDFHAYKLIKNVENQGTVKNSLSALQHTDSKYIKGISPGDFLYDENTLFDIVDFAEKNSGDAIFGNAVYYSVDEKNEIKIYDDKRNPKDLTPWIEQNYRKIRRNYFVIKDFVLGASLLCNRVVFYEFLKRLDGVVKYTEDLSIMWMIAARKKVMYYNRPFVFYEYGSGISTNTNEIWSRRIIEDLCKVAERMYENKDISKIEFISLTTKNRFFRIICRFILDPLYFFRLLKRTQMKNTNGNKDEIVQSLERIFNRI